MKPARISLIVVLVLCILATISRYKYPSAKAISWDVAGYYLYLPATFIYHDPGLSNYSTFDSLRSKYEFSSTFYQVSQTPKGRYMIKYTMGSALLYAPFFGVAHMWAKGGHFPADGFSYPYEQTLMWGMLLYVFLSLFLVRKILLEFFDDSVSSICLVVVFLGTNLYYYLSLDNLQVHVLLFFLYTLFLWLTIWFFKRQSMLRGFLLGLVGGLIVLTRPTDLLVIVVPMFWSVCSWKTGMTQIRNSVKYFPFFMLGVVMFFLPQIFYWKFVYGSWLVNSYTNPGEGLDLFTPHTFNFLFSYRKGWLVYTPLAICILPGIWMALKAKAPWAFGVLCYFTLFIWIASSWTCWWYASSVGSRAMIQSYAIGMLPMGLFIQKLKNAALFKRYLGGVIILLLIILNMFQTWQFIHKILKQDRMTKAYYWHHFLATSVKPQSEKWLLKDKFLDTDTFPNPDDFICIKSYNIIWGDSVSADESIRTRLLRLPNDSTWSLLLDKEHVFYTVMEQPYAMLTQKNFGFVRIECWMRNDSGYDQNRVELVRTMEHKGKLYAYTSSLLKPPQGRDTLGWWHFKLDYVLPDVRKRTDKFKGYFWLRGTDRIFIRELKVGVWEERIDPSEID